MIISIWYPKFLSLLGLIMEIEEWMMNIIDEVFIHSEMDIKTSISNAIWLNVLWINIYMYIYHKNLNPAFLTWVSNRKPIELQERALTFPTCLMHKTNIGHFIKHI